MLLLRRWDLGTIWSHCAYRLRCYASLVFLVQPLTSRKARIWSHRRDNGLLVGGICVHHNWLGTDAVRTNMVGPILCSMLLGHLLCRKDYLDSDCTILFRINWKTTFTIFQGSPLHSTLRKCQRSNRAWFPYQIRVFHREQGCMHNHDDLPRTIHSNHPWLIHAFIREVFARFKRRSSQR